MDLLRRLLRIAFFLLLLCDLCRSTLVCASDASWAVSTVATGAGSDSGFTSVSGIAIHGESLFIADKGTHTIRKVEIRTGAVSTIAGSSGHPGSADGVGTEAGFNGPTGITADNNSLYVSDRGNHSIRKLDIDTGVVTTVAGTGKCGWADGTGKAASFCRPEGVVTDGTYLYVADNPGSGATIRKIAIATTDVTTLAGKVSDFGTVDGIGTAATINYPMGVATDGKNLYVTEWNGNTIRKIDLETAEVTTVAGNSHNAGLVDGTGTAACFKTPYGIAVDGANLFVTDKLNNAIRKVVIATGEVITLPSGPDMPGKAANWFNHPTGVATDGNTLYIVNTGKNTIVKIQNNHF